MRLHSNASAQGSEAKHLSVEGKHGFPLSIYERIIEESTLVLSLSNMGRANDGKCTPNIDEAAYDALCNHSLKNLTSRGRGHLIA